MSKISIIAPVFNEEEVVEKFYKKAVEVMSKANLVFEIIFVNDGSTDKTPDILKGINKNDPRVKVLSFSRNFGHAPAISAGLDYASGEAIVVIDSDLQDPPEVILEFIEKWREGYYVIYGIRAKRKEWWGKRFCYWFFYRVLRSLSSFNMPVDSGDFCLMDRVVVESIKSLPERNRFVRGLRGWVGFKQYGLVYERSGRFAGVTKYPLSKLIKLAADGIFSFSSIPLKIATWLGFIFTVGSLAATLVLAYTMIFGGMFLSLGFAVLTIVVLFLSGIQLISTGVLGEYVARIYEEAKHRPLYVVKEKIGF